jgi:ribonuclease HI
LLNWDKDKAFEILTSLPTLAEACVIRWALQRAKNENLAEIIVESDAKVCVDTLNLVNVECNWNILTLCKDIHVLAADFFSCNFCWVKREANSVAHVLAKSVLSQNLLVFHFPNHLPSLLEKAWFRDLSCIPFG